MTRGSLRNGVWLAALSWCPALAAQATEGSAVELDWNAPSECPSATSVRDTVARLVKQPEREVQHEVLRASAVVTADAEGIYRLHLTTNLGVDRGERDLSGDSCAALANSAALILALMLNPTASLDDLEQADAPAVLESAPPENAPKGPSTGPGATRSGPTAVTPEREKARPLRALHLALRAGIATNLGVLPEAGRGAGGAFAVIYNALRLEASATYWLNERRTLPRRASGGDFSLFTGGFTACGGLASRVLTWDLCGGVDLGRLRAVAFGVRDLDAASALWLGLAGGGGLTVRLVSPLALRAELVAVVPLVRPDFVLEGVGSVHQPAPLAARGGIGLEAHF